MPSATLAILQIQLVRAGYSDEHRFSQSVLNIGRAADNDVILDDPQVSAHHLRIEHAEDRFTVTDLRSTNGTRVNGLPLHPMTPTPLRPGDVIELIEFRLMLRLASREPGDMSAHAERVQIGVQARPGLVILPKGQPAIKAALDKPVMTLGRATDNDIVIERPQVSRHHAQIAQENGDFVITDQGSANGLFFQGQRVPKHTLADGDVLTIGDSDEVALQFRASIGFLPVVEPEQATRAMPPVSTAAPAADLGVAGLLDLKGMETITIGRAPDNRIVLDHPQVSRHHALIERMGTRYRIRDLKSSNGVFVNSARVEHEAWLKEGDEIRIGPLRLVLREDGIEQFAEEGLRLDGARLNKWVSKDKNLLQDISLSILPQEFVALVGPSGSGKSTLLDAINGSRPATHGQVCVNGIDLYRNLDLFRNDMGYVPQKDIVHAELTVYQALDYVAQLRMPADTRPADRRERVMQVLRDLDLAERQDLPIHKLSGGQLKRVNIGVELLTQPRLFFLDEPTSGLDPGTEFEMMTLLRKLADQGRTILLVTHATKNVMMCDRVIFLAQGGYLAYFGPPEQALPYFDQYRTPRERQLKDIEFDDIYRILDDESRGRPQDWAERYRRSRQYQEDMVARLQDRAHAAPASQPVKLKRQAERRQRARMLRQFLILSARNLRILTQDRASLLLMLALAPVIGLMDFIWGNKLFDVNEGDAGKAITMLFMAALISLIVGALSSVREIVKENEIYKRERAVNLRVAPYILSKVWIGVVIALYQSLVFLLFKLMFVRPPLDGWGVSAFYWTLVLSTLSGYLMGLLVSAAAPNQNAAMILLIAALVPQLLFSGALLPLNVIPGGQVISAAMPVRWSFEALVNITGLGYDVAHDVCWSELTAQEREGLSEEQKVRLGCRCMGTTMFEACRFPGLRAAYDEAARRALNAPAPVEPLEPTPYPTLTPIPSPSPLPSPTPLSPDAFSDQTAYRAQVEKQQQDHAGALKQQSEDYARLKDRQMLEDVQLRQKQAQEFKDLMRLYGDQRAEWEKQRGKAVAISEGKIKAIVESLGHTFKGGLIERWLAMVAIMGITFVLVVVFQKRKDVI